MTKTAPTPSTTTEDHPPGASLHLGGNAWANPTLTPHLVPIDTLTPYPGNPRRGDQHAITSSIRDHGLYAGVVHQTSTGRILVGNHRRHALIDLGATLIPAVAHDCDDTLAAAIVARDNRTSDTGGYHDRDLLALLEREGVLPRSGYVEEGRPRPAELHPPRRPCPRPTGTIPVRDGQQVDFLEATA